MVAEAPRTAGEPTGDCSTAVLVEPCRILRDSHVRSRPIVPSLHAAVDDRALPLSRGGDRDSNRARGESDKCTHIWLTGAIEERAMLIGQRPAKHTLRRPQSEVSTALAPQRK